MVQSKKAEVNFTINNSPIERMSDRGNRCITSGRMYQCT